MIFTKTDKLSKSALQVMTEGDKEMHYIFVDMTDFFNRNGLSVNDNYDVEDIIKTQNLTPIDVEFDSENGTFEAHSYKGAEPILELIRRINQHIAYVNPKVKVETPSVGFKKTSTFGGGALLTTFKASYNDVKAIFGKANLGESGDQKCSHEWQLKDDNGNIYNIYDWKEYRKIPKKEVICYHIGGNDIEGANRLKALFA